MNLTTRDIGLALRDGLEHITHIRAFNEDEPTDVAIEIADVDVSDPHNPVISMSNGQEFTIRVIFSGGNPPVEIFPGWTTFDADAAQREGWNIFDSDSRGLEIEADSESDIFVRDGNSYDDEALALVQKRAAEGSDLHKRALAIHKAARAELAKEVAEG